MARTKTQKALMKAQRTGTRCPEQNRRTNGDYGAVSQHVRIMPGKREKLNKIRQKERVSWDNAPFACPA